MVLLKKRIGFIVLCGLLTLHVVEVAGKRVRRGESCRARHLVHDGLTDGRCMPLHECLQTLKDINKLKFPRFCGIRAFLPVVCCPLTETPTRLPEPSTTTTTAAPPPPPPPPPVIVPPVLANFTSTQGATLCETARDEPGLCLPLDECASLQEEIRLKMFPPLCDWKNGKAYSCCPQNVTPALTTTPAPIDRTLKKAELLYENAKYCGKTSRRQGEINFVPVVLGGKKAPTGVYPFTVALFRDRVSVLNFWCGGTLITKTVVLSAAHCFYNSLNDTHYLARIGGVNISEANTDPFIQAAVSSISMHPNYNERQHYADVALLVLDRSVRSSSLRRPFACLPDVNADPTAYYGTVLGWGHDNFGGRLQTHLQEARIPIISTETCNAAYQSLGSYDREFPRGINGDFICAGNVTDGGVDACQQDSGGPLVTNTTTSDRNYFEVVGIVSFGVTCGSARYPGVYTRVATFRDWIIDTMANVVGDDYVSAGTRSGGNFV